MNFSTFCAGTLWYPSTFDRFGFGLRAGRSCLLAVWLNFAWVCTWMCTSRMWNVCHSHYATRVLAWVGRICVKVAMPWRDGELVLFVPTVASKDTAVTLSIMQGIIYKQASLRVHWTMCAYVVLLTPQILLFALRYSCQTGFDMCWRALMLSNLNRELRESPL